MDSWPTPPPPRVRTCNGCTLLFRIGAHRKHVRNDCGRMISVQLLRDAIQKAADESDSDWIQFSDIGMIIEHIAASRMSAIDAGLREDEDLEIEVEGRRTTLLAYKKRARERLASRVQRRAERGVHSITDEMSRMEI